MENLLSVVSCEKLENGYFLKIEYPDTCTYEEKLYIDGKGGVIGDLGKIGDSNILVVREGGVLVDKEVELGTVTYQIDSMRRCDVMENHSGEHLLSGLAFLKYGWRTFGFRMSEVYATLDFDVENVDNSVIQDLEYEINKLISENHKLSEKICSLEEAKEMLGERKDLPEKITGDVRVLSLFPGDVNPCAGLHVKSTLEIKLFKIIYTERVKGGYTRFYFLSGNRALRDYQEKHNITRELCKKLSAENSDILNMVDKQLTEKKELKNTLGETYEKYSKLLLKDLLENGKEEIKGNILLVLEENKGVIEFIKKELYKRVEENILLITYNKENYSILSKSIQCNKILLILKEKNEIKGGGSPKEVTFFTKSSLEKIADEVREIMKTL